MMQEGMQKLKFWEPGSTEEPGSCVGFLLVLTADLQPLVTRTVYPKSVYHLLYNAPHTIQRKR